MAVVANGTTTIDSDELPSFGKLYDSLVINFDWVTVVFFFCIPHILPYSSINKFPPPLHCMQTRWASARMSFSTRYTFEIPNPWELRTPRRTIVNRSPEISGWYLIMSTSCRGLFLLFPRLITMPGADFFRKMRFRVDIQKALLWSKGVESRGKFFFFKPQHPS